MSARARRKERATPARESAKELLPGGLDETRDLDRLIHQPVRLALVSALAVSERLSFNELKKILEVSDGNLSVHARKLEEGGYVHCEKTFADRVPRTEFRLTTAGRAALEEYLGHMEALIRAVRKG